MTNQAQRIGPAQGSNAAQLIEIEKHKKAGCNMIILCNPYSLPELHRIVIGTVQLDPDPSGNDVYPAKAKGKFHLHAGAKLKFQFQAAIQWDPNHTGPVTSTKDYCQCSAVGFIQTEFGKPVPFRGDAEMDMECILEDLNEEYTAKGKKADRPWSKEYIDECVKRDFKFKRQHKVKLTSTSAKGVVIDKLLGLKSAYTREELQKPFVIVRTVVAPDLSDPKTLAELRRLTLQSISGVYGPQRLLQQPAYDDDDSGIIDITPAGREREPQSKEPEEPPQHQITDLASFVGASKKDQEDHLLELADRKGYDMACSKKPLDQYSDSQRFGFFNALTAMQDIPANAGANYKDDIPY